jgi:Ubiquitin fusion degradation protein UFD1
MFFGGGYGDARMMMGGGGRRSAFETQYQCFSSAMSGRSNIDEGDKILLPPSALDALARMNVEYPMLFELRNDAIGKKTHCGVMEFSAEEGRCYVPFWMMQNLLVCISLRILLALFVSVVIWCHHLTWDTRTHTHPISLPCSAGGRSDNNSEERFPQ